MHRRPNWSYQPEDILFWLSSRNFFGEGGKSIVMLIFLLFSDQISGGGKSLRVGGKLPQEGPAPCGRYPVVQQCVHNFVHSTDITFLDITDQNAQFLIVSHRLKRKETPSMVDLLQAIRRASRLSADLRSVHKVRKLPSFTLHPG